MSLDDDIRIIASAQIFDALHTEQLRLLAFGSERLRFSKGRNIFRENDRADCGFVVASGEIDLVRLAGDEMKTVKTVGPGAIIGEMAMLTDTNRLTGAVAKTDCELIRINRSLFHRMLSEYPEIAADIHRDILERLQEFLASIGTMEHRFDDRHDF
ncbi:cyclic nucleotide-binding domain-containing protein [Ahrensia kielensis]|uniref:cyclic nucleotide-binding domain-containing protein n=1 Tax=Ahrensia kielensis TaxID=76980 RepID=UPI00037F8B8F|nr:cyclic nucleotide-binding domain-containing protein [Ahrensia kielensis]